MIARARKSTPPPPSLKYVGIQGTIVVSPSGQRGERAVPKPLRILNIEDEGAQFRLAVATLTPSCDLDRAVDVEQAIRMWNTNDYDLVLSDINLPGKEPEEHLRLLREAIDGPIIIGSSIMRPDHAEMAKRYRTTYLSKDHWTPEYIRTSMKDAERLARAKYRQGGEPNFCSIPKAPPRKRRTR